MNKYLEKIAKAYSEVGSTFTHEGQEYDLNKVLSLVRDKRVVRTPVRELAWVLQYDKTDPNRLAKADPKVPVVVVKGKHGLTAVDGLHRLSKAHSSGLSHIPSREITKDELMLAKKGPQ